MLYYVMVLFIAFINVICHDNAVFEVSDLFPRSEYTLLWSVNFYTQIINAHQKIQITNIVYLNVGWKRSQFTIRTPVEPLFLFDIVYIVFFILRCTIKSTYLSIYIHSFYRYKQYFYTWLISLQVYLLCVLLGDTLWVRWTTGTEKQ